MRAVVSSAVDRNASGTIISMFPSTALELLLRLANFSCPFSPIVNFSDEEEGPKLGVLSPNSPTHGVSVCQLGYLEDSVQADRIPKESPFWGSEKSGFINNNSPQGDCISVRDVGAFYGSPMAKPFYLTLPMLLPAQGSLGCWCPHGQFLDWETSGELCCESVSRRVDNGSQGERAYKFSSLQRGGLPDAIEEAMNKGRSIRRHCWRHGFHDEAYLSLGSSEELGRNIGNPDFHFALKGRRKISGGNGCFVDLGTELSSRLPKGLVYHPSSGVAITGEGALAMDWEISPITFR